MATNGFRVKNSLNLSPVDLTQITDPQAGDLACDINDSNKIKRYDAAAASWKEVGSGGVGGTDILFVQDFESAALATFTQTGLSLSTSSPLHGNVSALMTHQNAVNQSFKQVIPVDAKFRGQAMTMRLNVKSNAPAGDVTLNIYDETNAANIVASEQLQLSNDTAGALSKIGFTIPATCTSLSYTVTALPEAGSPVTRVDDIIAELAVTSLLETSVEVPVVTEWQGYTPTFQGLGTVSNIQCEWRQVGQDVEIRAKLTTGTTTAVEARVGLPGGLSSANTDLIPSIQKAGDCAIGANADSEIHVLIEPSVSYVTFSYQSPTTAGLTKATGVAAFNSSTNYSFIAKVPCAGLSATSTKTIDLTQSGLVQNSDSSLQAYGSAGQSITALVTDIPFSTTVLTGSDIQFNGSSVTLLTEGIYSISAQIDFTTSLSRTCELYKNGILYKRIGDINATNDKIANINYTDKFNAGDVISLRAGANGGTLENSPTASTSHYLTVTKQSSLKQVSVSSDQKIKIPTSELRFEGASSRGAVATAIVKFDTLAKIRGDAFTVTNTSNDGTFVTMRKAGLLSASATVAFGSAVSIYLSRNQTTLTTIPATSETLAASSWGDTYCQATWTGSVNVGDIIRVSTTANNPSNTNYNSLNLSFQEQDIAVSVTNTLPQFSESDSSIRLDTPNGYGSSAIAIPRFSNIRQNIGTDITYNPNSDEATNGASFRVNSAGIYSVSFSYGSVSGTSRSMAGISLNSTQLTTSVDGINAADRLAIQYQDSGANAEICSVAWTGYLNSGDVVRPHTDGNAQQTPFLNFTISKVGKPNVTGVDVTPFVKIPQNDVDRIETIYEATTALLDTTAELRFDPAVFVTRTNKGIITVEDDSTNTRTKFVALKRCNVHVSFTAAASTIGGAVLYKNGSTYFDASYAPAGNFSTLSAPVSLEPGEFISLQRTNITAGSGYTIKILAEAASDSIITASESFSTDTASLSYAGSGTYTLSTLANAPVGTFITFIKAGTNALTQTTVAPTQTTSDMSTNGILSMLGVTGTSTTAGAPGAFAIQIGKGLKGKDIQVFKSSGKTTAGYVDGFNAGTSATGVVWTYNEKTGVLYWTTCNSQTSTVTSWGIGFEDNSFVSNGTQVYLVINASKSPALVGVPLLQPRIALASNVLASNTSGQFISGSTWTAVNMNTLSDPSGVVTSLASNQITMQPGQYYVESFVSIVQNSATTPTNSHTRIRNITTGTTALFGHKSQHINSALSTDIVSTCQGYITVASPTVFEVQAWASSGGGANIGNAGSADSSENKTPVLLKITKIK